MVCAGTTRRHPSVSVGNGLCRICQLGLNKYMCISITKYIKIKINPGVVYQPQFGITITAAFAADIGSWLRKVGRV